MENKTYFGISAPSQHPIHGPSEGLEICAAVLQCIEALLDGSNDLQCFTRNNKNNSIDGFSYILRACHEGIRHANQDICEAAENNETTLLKRKGIPADALRDEKLRSAWRDGYAHALRVEVVDTEPERSEPDIEGIAARAKVKPETVAKILDQLRGPTPPDPDTGNETTVATA